MRFQSHVPRTIITLMSVIFTFRRRESASNWYGSAKTHAPAAAAAVVRNDLRFITNALSHPGFTWPGEQDQPGRCSRTDPIRSHCEPVENEQRPHISDGRPYRRAVTNCQKKSYCLKRSAFHAPNTF